MPLRPVANVDTVSATPGLCTETLGRLVAKVYSRDVLRHVSYPSWLHPCTAAGGLGPSTCAHERCSHAQHIEEDPRFSFTPRGHCVPPLLCAAGHGTMVDTQDVPSEMLEVFQNLPDSALELGISQSIRVGDQA